MLTSILLLNVQFRDRMLSELMTLDILWVCIWGSVVGFGAMAVIRIIIRVMGIEIGHPKVYNISGALMLLFAILLYIHVRNIALADLTMATFIAVVGFYIFPGILILFAASKKISLMFTFGISFFVFLLSLTLNYWDMMFLDLKIADLTWYSICAVLSGTIALVFLRLLAGTWGDFNISGDLILVFSLLLLFHMGTNKRLWDVTMATFISVLTIFSFFLIIGIFLITKYYMYRQKRGERWQ